MFLEPTNEEAAREEHGYSFPMRIAGSAQTVRVLVSEDALIARVPAIEEQELEAQLKSDRPALEALAREKFDQGRVSAVGEVLITANDALSFIE